MSIEKEESQQRKEEREHEMRMLYMMLGNPDQPNNANISPIPSILNAYPYASVQQQNFRSVSSMSTPTYAVNEDKTYFSIMKPFNFAFHVGN